MRRSLRCLLTAVWLVSGVLCLGCAYFLCFGVYGQWKAKLYSLEQGIIGGKAVSVFCKSITMVTEQEGDYFSAALVDRLHRPVYGKELKEDVRRGILYIPARKAEVFGYRVLRGSFLALSACSTEAVKIYAVDGRENARNLLHVLNSTNDADCPDRWDIGARSSSCYSLTLNQSSCSFRKSSLSETWETMRFKKRDRVLNLIIHNPGVQQVRVLWQSKFYHPKYSIDHAYYSCEVVRFCKFTLHLTR